MCVKSWDPLCCEQNIFAFQNPNVQSKAMASEGEEAETRRKVTETPAVMCLTHCVTIAEDQRANLSSLGKQNQTKHCSSPEFKPQYCQFFFL
jgi:hypothetical protein